MQFIISSPIEKLFTFQVSDQVLSELKMVMKKYLHIYIDRDFKSLPILDSIVSL
jgi:DNA repair protein RecO (recombination protein O)